MIFIEVIDSDELQLLFETETEKLWFKSVTNVGFLKFEEGLRQCSFSIDGVHTIDLIESSPGTWWTISTSQDVQDPFSVLKSDNHREIFLEIRSVIARFRLEER